MLGNVRQPWTNEELMKLESLCKSCTSRAELRKKCSEVFPQRSWDSVRFQLFQRHPKWIEHFGEREVPELTGDATSQMEGHLGISQENLEQKTSRLLEILKKGPTTVKEISEDRAINIPKEAVFPLIDLLRTQGYDVVEDKRRVYLRRYWPHVGQSLPPVTKRNRIEVLFMEGLCLGLKTQQGDLVATALAIGEQREVFINVILGNLVAGVPPKSKSDEYFLATVDEQAEYVISHFPKASFNTYLLNGSRELSFRRKGERIESLICSNRDDIRYIGDEKAFLPIGGNNNAKVAIVSQEAQAYTKSYPLQGMAENFQEAVHYIFEHSEPFRSLLVGGLHSGILLPRQLPIDPERYNDFDMVAIPTLHRITSSQVVSRRRGASPVLGCLVLGANFNDAGDFTGFTYAFYDLTAYFRDDDYLEDVEIDERLSEEAKKVLLRLKKGPARPGVLSRLIGRAIKKEQNSNGVPDAQPDTSRSVQEAIEELQEAGFQISFDEKARKAYELTGRELRKEFKPLDLKKIFQTRVRLLLTSDWHVGHQGERPDLIRKVFEIAEERKVDVITCSGNVFEGYGSYDSQALDLLHHGADAQRKRLFEIMPKSEIPLVLIGSPVREHDRVFWAKVGHDIVDTFSEIAQLKGYRVQYLGGPHGTFKLKDITFDMQHPKGGLPYGQTYRVQRRLEMLVSHMNLSSGAKASFIGHLHRAAFMLYKGMGGFLVPCLKDSPEDEYIVALDKLAELGVWVAEMAFDAFKNLTKVELEYVPFEPRQECMRKLNLDETVAKWKTDGK